MAGRLASTAIGGEPGIEPALSIEGTAPMSFMDIWAGVGLRRGMLMRLPRCRSGRGWPVAGRWCSRTTWEHTRQKGQLMEARKLLAALVVLVTGSLGIAACGDDGSGGGSGGKVTMTFWHNATTGDGKAFWDKTVADFEAANPNVKINIQSIQNEDMDGKLQTALNSGSAPDVFLQRGGGKMAAWSRPAS